MEQTNKQKNIRKSHDVSGIILIIISAFFLICLLTPLLSDIGAFVKTLTLGVIGYVSYPFFAVMLLLGIIMLTGKKSALTKKQLAFVFVLAFFAVLILQTATTNISLPFDEYISAQIASDRDKSSVGGVLFGIAAYGIAAVLTPLGAYILYGAMFALFAALFIRDFAVTSKNEPKKSKKTEEKKVRPFVKGGEAAPIQEVTDTSLFIGNIIPGTQIKSQSGQFGSLYDPLSGPESSRYGKAVSDCEYKEESSRDKARKILFGDKEDALRTYKENVSGAMKISEVHRSGGRYNGAIDDNVGIPASVSYGNSQSFSYEPTLPEVPVPPQKDISSRIIKREIYNAEEISKELEDSESGADKNEQAQTVTQREKEQIYEKNKTIYAYEPDGEKSENIDNTIGRPTTVTSAPCIKDAEAVNETVDHSDDLRKEDEFPKPIERKCTIVDAENEVNQEVVAIDIDREPTKSESKFSDDYEIIERRPDIDHIEQTSVEPENDSSYDNTDFAVIERSQTATDSHSEDIGQKDELTPKADNKMSNDKVEDSDDENSSFVDSLPSHSEQNVDTSTDNVENEKADYEEVENVSTADEDAFSVTGKRIVCGDEDEVDDVVSVDEKDSEAESDNIEGKDNSEPISDDNSEEIGSECVKEENEDAYIASKIPASLKLAADIDMTENRGEVNDDNTGYYTTEDTFDRNVSKLALAIDSSSGRPDTQIKMEDYSLKGGAESQPKPKKKKKLRYNVPPTDILNLPIVDESEKNIDYTQQTESLEQILSDLKVPAKVTNIVRGPAVTRFELEMPSGLSVKRITTCQEDIAYALAARGNIRIEAPIRGKRAVGVEVPNESVSIVTMREILESNEFKSASSPLTIALGKDIAGDIVLCNLEKMPHLLIAGSTGTGKSVCLNSIIVSLIYKSSPDDVRIILIDPKRVEFVMYKEMPHLLMKNIVNDIDQAINTLKWAVSEMERRYTVFAKYAVRNINEYNECDAVKNGIEVKLPKIVIIVDEFGDLMLNRAKRNDLEHDIMSIAQKARAAGMHLILATQRPSVDVITGTIKANLSSRIAFAVNSFQDSRTILDQGGADALLGKGDMLYSPLDSNTPRRVQGAFISNEEILSVIDYVKSNNETDYDEAVEKEIMVKNEPVESVADEENGGVAADEEDPILKDVIRKGIEMKTISTSYVQRRFKVGYVRAARIMDQLEDNKYIGPVDGSKSREVYITAEQFKEKYGEDV